MNLRDQIRALFNHDSSGAARRGRLIRRAVELMREGLSDADVWEALVDELAGSVPVFATRLDTALEWEWLPGEVLDELFEEYDGTVIERGLDTIITMARRRLSIERAGAGIGIIAPPAGVAMGSLADLLRHRRAARAAEEAPEPPAMATAEDRGAPIVEDSPVVVDVQPDAPARTLGFGSLLGTRKDR